MRNHQKLREKALIHKAKKELNISNRNTKNK